MKRSFGIAVLLMIFGASLTLAGSVMIFMMNDGIKACTEMGCNDALTVNVSNNVSNQIGGYSYLEIDGETFLDKCKNINRIGGRPDIFRIDPEALNHSENQEIIKTIKFGICGVKPEIKRIFKDVEVKYNDYRPNGQGCPPTCLQGKIVLDND